MFAAVTGLTVGKKRIRLITQTQAMAMTFTYLPQPPRENGPCTKWIR